MSKSCSECLLTVALVCALFVYIAGGFLTNAYCQVYRWDDWVYRYFDRYGNFCVRDDSATQNTLWATIAWPVYWASRISFWIVEEIGD